MNDELITQYLLGSLSSEEAERLDELSLTDDEFAVRLQEVENELLDAYVRGELSGQTLEQFNSFYLSSPRRRERVGFAQALHTVTERAAVGKQATNQQAVVKGPQLSPRSSSPWASGLRVPSSPRRALQWGLAAAASLLLVAGGWLVYENLRLRQKMQETHAERGALQQRERELETQLAQQRSSALERGKETERLREQIARLEQPSQEQRRSVLLPEAPSIVPFVLAPQTRGLSQIATVPIPSGTDYVTLQLELESGGYPLYRVELKTQPDGQVVWRSRPLKAQARGDGKVVIVSLRPGLLKSSMHILEVSGISASDAAEIIGSYPFRAVAQ
jgi:hypothetical protein